MNSSDLEASVFWKLTSKFETFLTLFREDFEREKRYFDILFVYSTKNFKIWLSLPLYELTPIFFIFSDISLIILSYESTWTELFEESTWLAFEIGLLLFILD